MGRFPRLRSLAKTQSSGATLSGQPTTLAGLNIIGIQPSTGTPGSQLTITGSGFGSVRNDIGVVLGGEIAQVTSWSDTQIVVTVPNLSAGSYSVTVNTIAGPQFMVVAPADPTVASIAPQAGHAGTVVTIAGSNFGNQVARSSVSLNYVSFRSIHGVTRPYVSPYLMGLLLAPSSYKPPIHMRNHRSL